MKRYLLAGVGVGILAGFVGTAWAADLQRQPPMYKAPPYLAPVFNWSGAYVGLNAGGGWGTSKWNNNVDNFDVSGGMIGGTLGYNWQFGTWVLGVEGDADWTGIGGNGTFGKTDNNFLSTIRGRAGYAFDRWMPYLTGGLAIGNLKVSGPFGSDINEMNVGWTAGAGVEFAFAPQWTAKVEYLYVDLGNVTCGVGSACWTVGSDKADFTSNIVRGGVNYRF